MAPFLVLGTPRSRTAWLARFLTHGEWICHHEPSAHFRTLDDLSALLHAPHTGASDSLLTFRWRDVVRQRPDARIVAVRRPIYEVCESFKKIRFVGVSPALERLEKELTALESSPGIFRVGFDDLNDEAVCAALFTHCLGYAPPNGWWRSWADQNIQADLDQTISLAVRNAKGIRRMFGEYLGD